MVPNVDCVKDGLFLYQKKVRDAFDCKPIPNPTECNAKLGAQEGKVLEDEACKLFCHYDDSYVRDHDTH